MPFEKLWVNSGKIGFVLGLIGFFCLAEFRNSAGGFGWLDQHCVKLWLDQHCVKLWLDQHRVKLWRGPQELGLFGLEIGFVLALGAVFGGKNGFVLGLNWV